MNWESFLLGAYIGGLVISVVRVLLRLHNPPCLLDVQKLHAMLHHSAQVIAKSPWLGGVSTLAGMLLSALVWPVLIAMDAVRAVRRRKAPEPGDWVRIRYIQTAPGEFVDERVGEVGVVHVLMSSVADGAQPDMMGVVLLHHDIQMITCVPIRPQADKGYAWEWATGLWDWPSSPAGQAYKSTK